MAERTGQQSRRGANVGYNSDMPKAAAAESEFDALVARARRGERVIVRRRKKPVAAVVPIADVELLERIEDEIDIREARKALRDPRRIPFERVMKELGL